MSKQQNHESINIGTKEPCVTFTKKKGCFVPRGVCILLVILFIGAIIVTGLLVYHYTPALKGDVAAHEGDEHHDHIHDDMMPTKSKHPVGHDHPPHKTTEKTPKKEKIDVRLPRSIKPIHYTVELQPFINGNFSIHGYVEVIFEVLQPTNNVSIHIADIITINDTINIYPLNDANNPASITRHEFDKEREFYIAHLGQNLQPDKYRMTMRFIGLLNDKLGGFYRSTYKDENGETKYLAVTQFQPTDARRAFPCFDEPGLKATFTISLARQTNMTAISNMPKILTRPFESDEGWVWDMFDKTVPMSTYLIAFVVSDFVYMNSTAQEGDSTLFRVWARENAIEQAEYARNVGPTILKFFENYFNIKFPLPKSDMIALPDFSAGAMENWGLITYRETAMLYDPLVSAAANKQRVGVVIAHELAHQWFGNLVTPEWWTDLWLNEGFASYMEYLGTDAAEPKWKMLEQFVIEDLQDVFGIDCLESSHPISIPVGHPHEISEIFDRISYAKGASIIRMMSHFLTEKTFREGLTKYLNSLKYGNAEQDDLWKFLTEEGHAQGTLLKSLTVKQVMDTWTLQMGYPVITVKRMDDGTASVEQERFLLVRSDNPSDTHDYRWWIPLTYTSQSNPNFEATEVMEWMGTDIGSKDGPPAKMLSGLPAKSEWVVFNIQQTGYYRVNYDEENWNALINQLKNDHTKINVINRAQIIDDSLDLARAGIIKYSTPLEVLSYLDKESEFVPWDSALNNLGYIEEMFKGMEGYDIFKKYALSLIVPLYNSVGFEDKLTDEHLDQYKRTKAISWSCNLGHEDCVQNSVNLFKMWMENPSNKTIISPNLKSIVYCVAIKHGGEAEWKFAWDRLQNSNVGTEKDKLLSALGCSNDTNTLSQYLDKAFTSNSGVRKQDATRVFGSVSNNKIGRELAWNYLNENWTKISEYFGLNNLGSRARVIKYGARNFKTKEQLMELKMFRKKNEASLGSGTRALDQSVERAMNNIAWMDRNYESISSWLATNMEANV